MAECTLSLATGKGGGPRKAEGKTAVETAVPTMAKVTGTMFEGHE